LFDKGGHLLKSAEFHKEKKEWLYQLKNAADLSDRADAVVALGKIKKDEEVVAALADALRNDKAWGVRATAADTLGELGGPNAAKPLLEAANSNDGPWVRSRWSRRLAISKTTRPSQQNSTPSQKTTVPIARGPRPCRD